MNVQFASDVHLEFLQRFPDECLISPAPDADVPVITGDIANGTAAIGLRMVAGSDGCMPVLHHASGASLNVHVHGAQEAMHRSHLTAERADERTRGC